jgi:hypothetical protein
MKSRTITFSQLPLLVTLLFASFYSMPNAHAEDEAALESEEEPQRNTVYFPQFQLFETVKNEEEMTGQITGRVELVDECLRIVTSQGSFLLVWPGWYDFSVAGREILINKINTDLEIAQIKVGDRVSLSGAELVYFPNTALQYKIPEHCLGPFWAVGEINTARLDVDETKEPSPPPKNVHKTIKITRTSKLPLPPKKEYYKTQRKPVQSNHQLKKLEIEIEKTILK